MDVLLLADVVARGAKNLLYLTKGISANNNLNGTRHLMSGAGFSKAERLSSQKLIASLFEAGQSFFNPPLTVLWQKAELSEKTPVQLIITVPKKYFPLAVDRNRIKRMIRESYRKNKTALYDHLSGKQIQLTVGIIYGSKKITTFNQLENKIRIALSELIRLAL